MEHIYESELLVSHSGARGRSSRGCLRGPDFVEQLLIILCTRATKPVQCLLAIPILVLKTNRTSDKMRRRDMSDCMRKTVQE